MSETEAKSSVAKWVGPVALAFLLAWTNPGRAEHEQRVREMVKEASPVASFLGIGHLVTMQLDYHDYIVFSTTYRNGELTTFGIFGLVF